MQRIICSRSIGRAFAASSRLAAAIAVSILVALSTNIGPAISMDLTVPSQEPSTTSDRDLPLDAFGYLGGLLEARFFEPGVDPVRPDTRRIEIGQRYTLSVNDIPVGNEGELSCSPRSNSQSWPVQYEHRG
jgi:hypothetical protein